MEGALLRFYVHEGTRVHGKLLWHWLLEEANKIGIRGGSAFRAMAGFGQHHKLHEERFFELQGSLTIEVEFIVSDDEAERLIALVEQQGQRVFYVRTAARFGVLNPPA